MKNILAENLLRFGVKNLNEKDKAVLSEALLLEQIQQVTTAMDALNTAMAAKPTGVGTHKIYPAISIAYGAALPANGQVLKATMIPRGLTSVTGQSVNNLLNASETVTGKPLPISLSCNIKTIKSTAGSSDNYAKFIDQLPDMNKIALWGTNYTDTKYSHPEAPYAKNVKASLQSYCGKYYATGTNGKFWDVNGVNANVTGNISDFASQIDTLVNSLAAIWINAEFKGISGTSFDHKYKLWCVAP